MIKLKLVDIAENEQINTDSLLGEEPGTGPYLSLLIEPFTTKIPNYWKLSDQKHLIEIGVDADNGKFNSICLILYNDTVSRIKDNKINLVHKKGIPVFDTGLWKRSKIYSGARHIENEGKFSISLGKTTMKIDLFTGKADNGVLIGNRAALLFDKGKELVSVLINDIDGREMKAIKAMLKAD